MREIKFRVWDKKNKRIDYVYKIFYGEITGKLLAIETSDKYLQEVNEFVLMQYTGLKDKNGNEIYEGDIVKAIFKGGYNSGYSRDWHTEKVKYLEYRGGYYPMTDCEMYRETDAQNVISSIEVIGNVYENPELLGV
jgi:uncharacterized phage protein (TIGR01671 family)